MSGPLITVIVSSYNRPKLLADALQSVRNQDGVDVQLIVADDYSDGYDVMRVCDRYVAALMRPLIKPTLGQRQWGMRCSDVINAALAMADGRYIAFLPDDDELLPGSLACRMTFLEEHPAATCVYGRLEACKPFDGVPKAGHAPERCEHDRESFYSPEPIVRAANKVDHGMMMVRNHVMPAWPGGVLTAGAGDGESFDCPDAGWFYLLERAGLGPFYSVPDFVVRKRYHAMGHRTDPRRRE